MATSTFDRKIELTDTKSIDKLLSILNDDTPESINNNSQKYDKNYELGNELLKQCISHSEN